MLVAAVLVVVIAVLSVAAVRRARTSEAASRIERTSFDGDGADVGDVLAGGLSLDWQIEYVDGEGRSTERRISVRSIHGDRWPEYVMAYCHLRRAPRIFRLDRIVELVDLSTGEFMPNPAGFARRIVNGRERAPRMRAVAGRRSGLS